MGEYNLYIVLTRTNSILSRLIYFFTKDDFTHSSLSFDRELSKMYSFSRKYARNPFIGCFKQEDLDKGLYGLKKELPGVIIKIKVSPEDYLHAKELVDQFIANAGLYKYNFKGLVFALFNREVYQEYHYLCSEFVYYVLRDSGLADFDRAGNLVRPIDFLSLDGTIVFEGNLKDLIDKKKPAPPMKNRVKSWYETIRYFNRVS